MMTKNKTQQFERVIIVTRPSEFDELVMRFNTADQAKFYLEQAGEDFSRIEQAHAALTLAVDAVKKVIPEDVAIQMLSQNLLARFDFADTDLVIVIGQDGLVANTAKYLQGQPIFAINPNPELYDGVLLPFTAKDFRGPLERALAGRFAIEPVTMAKVDTSDGQTLLAFNDFFIGAASHVSARYELEFDGVSENQSSSGIIISTGAGSTGWLKSIYQGAANVARAMGGKLVLPDDGGALPWDTNTLPFVVREPFPSRATSANLTVGGITSGLPLVVRSRMVTNGVIFSDGIESDYIAFNEGMTATFSIADINARLIG